MFKRFKLSRKGKILMWESWLEEEDGFYNICSKSGQVTGKQNIKKTPVRKGTNIGKSNEKSIYENALFMLKNRDKKKYEDNWVTDINDVHLPWKFIKPMLAKKFEKKKAKFGWPCGTKIDGVRGTMFLHLDDDRLLSRERNRFVNVPFIEDELKRLFGKYSPDGEIYKHGHEFEEINSRVKKVYDDPTFVDPLTGWNLLTKDLEFWVFDLAIPDMKYKDRKLLLDRLIPGNHKFIRAVHEFWYSEDKLDADHERMIKLGYEGLIIRDPDSYYEFNTRSSGLMKDKKFTDKEFEICDIAFEEYHDIKNNTIRKMIKWICVDERGEKFSVRPKGSYKSRIYLYENNPEQFIGQWLTVKYQNLSEYDVPRFGVGKGLPREGFFDGEKFIPSY